MRITDTSAIKSAIDIENFIGQYVKMKNGYGLCPFHREKSPSFHVNIKEKFYKCFGCGAAGDVITFYQTIEGVPFLDAVKALADMAGISVESERARHPQESLVLAVEASVWFDAWRRILVAARNQAYDTGEPSSAIEELYENHMASGPKDAITAYRRVRTPEMATRLRAQHQEELDALAACKAYL